MKKFKFFLKNFEEIIASSTFALMIVMVSVNVISRFVFLKSFRATEEIAYLGFVYSVFFGICIVYKNNAMIAVDFIVDRLPQKIRKIITIFNYALLAVFNIVMVYYSITLAAEAWLRPTAALRIPYTFMDLPAVFAFSMMTIYSINFLITTIRGKEIKTVLLEDRS